MCVRESPPTSFVVGKWGTKGTKMPMRRLKRPGKPGRKALRPGKKKRGQRNRLGAREVQLESEQISEPPSVIIRTPFGNYPNPLRNRKRTVSKISLFSRIAGGICLKTGVYPN